MEIEASITSSCSQGLSHSVVIPCPLFTDRRQKGRFDLLLTWTETPNVKVTINERLVSQ